MHVLVLIDTVRQHARWWNKVNNYMLTKYATELSSKQRTEVQHV